MSLANVSIVGNLCKDPKLTQFTSGKTKTTVVVAVNTPFREKRGGDAADFYKVEVWGKMASTVAANLNKGNQITANGRLVLEKWIDQNGRERITPTVSATDIVFPRRAKSAESVNSSQRVEEVAREILNADAPTTAEPDVSFPEADARPSPSESPPIQASSDEDCEFDEDEIDEDDDEDDSFGQPNSTHRPAPTREHHGRT